MSEEFWQNKIKAFLHDPPDKALILFHVAHEEKRDDILSTLGLKYESKFDPADFISSAMQRLYIPEEYRMDQGGNCKNHICFKGPNRPVFKHTLSGESAESIKEIKDFVSSYGYEKMLNKFGFDTKVVKKFLEQNNWKKTYFSVWRFLPEEYPLGYTLPADTRIPDHSIWDHLDVTAALSSCEDDIALFALKIQGVQEFITHSRKLSDLWASSYIFSLLLFEGIKQIISDLGPDVIIYPQLRGNPLLDYYLKNEINIDIPLEKEDELKIASLPNTFLCFVPFSKAKEYEKRCKKAIHEKWQKISVKAREYLDEIKPDERLWNNQIENSLAITVTYMKMFDYNSYKNVTNNLPEDIRNTQNDLLTFVEKPNCGYFYFSTYSLLGAVLTQASRMWDGWEERPETGKKCLMCGLRNALVEKRGEDVYRYWDGKWEKINVKNGVKSILKGNERLCAVCLVKRIYRTIFEEEFKINPPKFQSVAEIAGRDFINKIENTNEFRMLAEEEIELIYEHEWDAEDRANMVEKLRGKNGDIYKKLKELWGIHGKPNKYYAILMMDGDRIGKMLSGETLLKFGEFLHPIFEKNIRNWKEAGEEKGEKIINMRRILTPSHHIAISRAMKDFSLYVVPKIVEKHNGFLVYAGGDDVLALFPADKALVAAYHIQEHFKKDFFEWDVDGKKRKLMGLGHKASMSAGIVFAHYNWPLYDAIERVREAVKRAKREIDEGGYGRNALFITFIKSSGEILTGGGKWEMIRALIPKDEKDVGKLTIIKVLSPRDETEQKLSHRFIYDLIDVIRELEGEGGKWDEESVAMLKSEIKRLIKRRNYKERLKIEDIEKIHGEFCRLIDNYRKEGIPLEDIGKLLKILYDADRGEE